MGNRAVITTMKREIGVYLHWNGGRDSVAAFLKYCELRQFIPPEEDGSGWARLCQVVGNYFNSSTSLSIDRLGELDCDNGDNGVFVISNWRIVAREHFTGPEQNSYDLLDMLRGINETQPEQDRLSDEEMETAAALERIEGVAIRPCVEDGEGNVTSAGIPDALAQFFGVYRQGKNGLWRHVEDFSSRKHASTFVLAMQEN